MLSERRTFLRNTSLLAGATLLAKPFDSFASVSKKINTVAAGKTIRLYYTGGLNGRIEANHQHQGGLKAIAKLIGQQELSGLILDSGNFLSADSSKDADGKVIAAMNAIGYHAATLGPNELKGGQATLLSLIQQCEFPIVNCNYTFSEVMLNDKLRTYQIIRSGKLRVGITGVGPMTSVGGITYNDAITCARRVSKYLKETELCDLVICLSQLGASDDQLNDRKLASSSSHIDFIVGGSEQKLNTGALILKNAKKHDVVFCYAGTEGALLGSTVFGYNEANVRNDFRHKYLVAGLAVNKSSLLANQRLHDLIVATV